MSRDQSRREPSMIAREEPRNILIQKDLIAKAPAIKTLSGKSIPSPDQVQT
jgi:hypothetical protein